MKKTVMACIAKIDEEDDVCLGAISALEASIERLERFTSNKDVRCIEYAYQKLAFVHSLRRDFSATEEIYRRWEAVTKDHLFVTAEKAFFLFAIKKDARLTLKHTSFLRQHLRNSLSAAQTRSLYRALNVRGRAQLALAKSQAAIKTMHAILDLIESNPGSGFAFELDFAEELAQSGKGHKETLEYLRLANWKDPEWADRADKLRASLRTR